jgi:hypothetical protein
MTRDKEWEIKANDGFKVKQNLETYSSKMMNYQFCA